ncbi:hypothetical protein [Melittangium boletus]|uniref:STAS domain-containing protein n=1 Tax=Melittangium boletus DSM 14713 TaxID=1294270 RepID=A0A250IA58_9BACT|nr:hypothetical protein [Melittangium boletus]ATB28051.1 hypothetical protein MEBOL_001496 [Melittangium boletus DSM 14713]
MNAVITFDDSQWPLLSVRLSGNVSDAQYAQYLEQMDAFLARGERFVCVIDVSQCSVLSVAQRYLHAAWIHKNEDLLRELLLGQSSVMTSAHMRLSRSMLNYVKPLPVPNAAVPDMDAALRYAAGRLEGEGCPQQAERIRHRFGLRIRQAG